jgi:hypothetical protein
MSVRVCVFTITMASMAGTALAQTRPPADVAVGVVLRERTKNLPKDWVASAAFPISPFVSVEFAGYGAYFKESAETEGPGVEAFSTAHEITAGVRVTPFFNDRVRTFGHFLVGPRFTTFGLRHGLVDESVSLKLAIVQLGAGVDVGSRRVSGRFLYDRVFSKIVKSTDLIDEPGWFAGNRLTAWIVFGF